MPIRLGTPVLQVDAGKMSQIDPRNVESLFGMWTVFHKSAESIEEGKRLENMSWRLWSRETFCCDSKPRFTPDASFDLSLSKPCARELPELSSSVSSAGSVEAERASPRRSPQDESPLSHSRGKEKHITPKRLEQLVVNIKEKTMPTPLSPAIAASVAALADTTPRPSSPSPSRPLPIESPEPRSTRSSDSQYSAGTVDSDMPVNLTGSDTSVSSSTANTTHSPTIVHGFSPSVSSIPQRSKPTPVAHSLKASTPQCLAPPKPEPKKKETKFIIGNGSVSEEESSFEERILKTQRSSLTEGLNRSASSSQAPKKQASFREILDSRPMDSEDAIESDDESVIDEEEEDDDSSWEDSDNESQGSSVEEKPMFQRVDSRPNLTSRRSLLTTALTQGDRAQALQRAAIAAQSSPNLRRSRRSSPIGPSMPGSPDEGAGLTMKAPESTRPKPIIVTTTNTHSAAHSPRTTRRNMLSTELTESLRKHLLWERQPRGGMANAAFKRSHTTQNMGNLREQANKAGPSDTSKNNSWNNYFDFGPQEYHAKGW